jgi:hypothetical protein
VVSDRGSSGRKLKLIAKVENSATNKKSIHLSHFWKKISCTQCVVEVLDSLMGCDLGNICAKAEGRMMMFSDRFVAPARE